MSEGPSTQVNVPGGIIGKGGTKGVTAVELPRGLVPWEAKLAPPPRKVVGLARTAYFAS